jgi:hypothetical protein
MDNPLRRQAGTSALGDNSYIGPEQGINGEQGAAPGGKSIADDLPMRSAHVAGSGFTEGFSPSSDNPPLPDPTGDVNAGVGLTPNGIRR